MERRDTVLIDDVVKKTDYTESQLLQFIHCDIGVYRLIEFTYYQGENFAQLVTFEKSPNGNYHKVCSKSLRISLNMMRVLIQNLESIDEHFNLLKEGNVQHYNLHLGENIHLRMDPDIKCVDIRKHFIPNGVTRVKENLKPGKPGVGLKIMEFENFRDLIDNFVQISNVMDIIPCEERDDHSLKEVVDKCKICNPGKIYF